MNYNIDPIYPTPVYWAYVDNFNIIQKELQSTVDKIDFKGVQGWGTTHLLSDPDFRENVLEKYECNIFIEELTKHLKQYLYTINYGEPGQWKIQDSWFAKFNKGHYAHIHSHGHADIAGVYYFQTNNEDGTIFFEAPSKCMANAKCYRPPRYEQRAEAGKILFFPGWLEHGVTTNTSDESRISLSFNIWLEASGGSETWRE